MVPDIYPNPSHGRSLEVSKGEKKLLSQTGISIGVSGGLNRKTFHWEFRYFLKQHNNNIRDAINLCYPHATCHKFVLWLPF